MTTTRLAVESLEARDVPSAVLDLTARGSSASANGALFRQSDGGPTGLGQTESIVRIQNDWCRGVEQGYNTDARPLQFDEARNRAVTQSVKVGELPLVTIGGKEYREVVLDVSERGWWGGSQVSLDELRVYVGGRGDLRGYNDRTDKLAGMTAVYDLDAGRDRWIKLDARKGSAASDMQFLIPAAALGSADGFVYLYSKFGGKISANGGGEHWLHRVVDSAPAPTTAAFSGTLYRTVGGEGGANLPVTTGILRLYLNGEEVGGGAAVGEDGSFTFADIPVPAGGATFELVYEGVAENPNDPPPVLATNSSSVTLRPGDNRTDTQLFLATEQ